jgi:hypothetical protein
LSQVFKSKKEISSQDYSEVPELQPLAAATVGRTRKIEPKPKRNLAVSLNIVKKENEMLMTAKHTTYLKDDDVPPLEEL